MFRVHLAKTGFELTTLMIIGTGCTGSYKSNFYAITTALINSVFFLCIKDYGTRNHSSISRYVETVEIAKLINGIALSLWQLTYENFVNKWTSFLEDA